MKPVITLLTDFGTKDHYVACMKGVIYGICPDATIVDISHEVEPFNILQGAFLLHQAVPWFPDGTIHVAVVDPGVGSRRRALILETRRAFFIGPDNGLMLPAARRLGLISAYEIDLSSEYFSELSWTFHGRDVFSPAAAYLAAGVRPLDMGEEIDLSSLADLSFWEPEVEGERAVGRFLHVDRFGNLITNLSSEWHEETASLHERAKLLFRGKEYELKIARAYYEGGAGELLLLPGSGGFSEIAVNMGSASSIIGAGPGDSFVIELQ